jgi:hypothetical protein
MTSHCVKSILALLLVLGLGLAFAVSPAAAAPLILDWRVIGVGVVGGTCSASPVLVTACTANSGGDALGTHIGNSTWILSVTTASGAANSSGGNCFVANGTGTVTAANGDVINYRTVGWLCEEAAAGTPYHYNGTYRITSGTGRFSAVVGGGNLASTNVRGGASFIKIDGTINF